MHSLDVRLQISFLGGAVGANRALKRSLSGVRAKVLPKVAFVVEVLRTNGAFVPMGGRRRSVQRRGRRKLVPS